MCAGNITECVDHGNDHKTPNCGNARQAKCPAHLLVYDHTTGSGKNQDKGSNNFSKVSFHGQWFCSINVRFLATCRKSWLTLKPVILQPNTLFSSFIMRPFGNRVPPEFLVCKGLRQPG